MSILTRAKNFVQNFNALSSVNLRASLTENWQNIFPALFDTGKNAIAVTPDNAQKLATVYSCLNVLGDTLGSLPCDVKQYSNNGAVTVYNHPVHRALHDRPNSNMTAFTFWSAINKLRKSWGNAYAEIVRDGESVKLEILEPWKVEILKNKSGEVFYKYEGRYILASNMLHFKNYSMTGIYGISTIKQNAMSIGLGLKLKEYNSSIIGERPYGYLTTDIAPKDRQTKDNIRNQWEQKKDEDTGKTAGVKPGQIAGLPILYGGVKFVPLTLPADDVAYIESAKLTDQDIYGIFRMPPTMVQNWERAPYNSSEQQDIVFVKYTLADIRDIEQECNEKLFPESNKTAENPLYVKFNLNGLLRGDTASRKEMYRTLINLGVMTPNQAAELEDLPTYQGGDTHYVQGAMVPVDLLREFIMSKTAQAQNVVSDPAQQRADIIQELKVQLKSKLNGHYKDVADILDNY